MMLYERSSKRQRSSAKSRLTRCVNSLTKLLDEESSNLCEATSLFDDVYKAWSEVETAHANHIATLEEELPEDDRWIIAEQDKFDKVRRQFIQYKERVSEQKALKEARHNRDICDIIYNEQYTLLESSLINGHSIQIILKNRDALQNKLAELEKAHRQVLILSKDTEDS